MNAVAVAPIARPYHIGPHYKTDIESRFGRIAEVCPQYTLQGEANARFLVRAANAHDALRDVVEAVTLFYDAPHWTPEKAARWERLTGSREATTKVLADSARAALGMVENHE